MGIYSTDDADYYRRQAEEAKAQVERLHRQEREREETRRSQRDQDIADRMTTADTWPEAFEKRIAFLEKEIRAEKVLNSRWDGYEDILPALEAELAQVKRAAELWARQQAEIDRLTREAVSAVASHLLTEGMTTVAEIMRQGDPEGLLTDW